VCECKAEGMNVCVEEKGMRKNEIVDCVELRMCMRLMCM